MVRQALTTDAVGIWKERIGFTLHRKATQCPPLEKIQKSLLGAKINPKKTPIDQRRKWKKTWTIK